MFSIFPLFFIVPLIDKKESKQLVIKRMMATVTNSSMTVLPEMFNNLREVSTTKQSPSRLEDAFRICGDLSLGSPILLFYILPGYCSSAFSKQSIAALMASTLIT